MSIRVCRAGGVPDLLDRLGDGVAAVLTGLPDVREQRGVIVRRGPEILPERLAFAA